MSRILFFILLFTLVFGLSACDNEDNQNTNNSGDTSLSSSDIPQIVKVKDKLFSVPSPMQAAEFIKNKNIPFNMELLNRPENYSKYLTTFKQALNIGVYGADLGNLFVYDQLSQSAQYFNVVKKLSEQVGVMNSINEQLLDRIENNSDNKDSLMFIISDIYREIDNYLVENDQQEIGGLIITGGWIESIYYLKKIVEKDKDPEIINRIAEQKNPLNNIIALLHPYYNEKSDEFDALIEQLVDLSVIFDGIEETYTYEPSETDPEKKLTIIHSTTTYSITDDEIQKISEKIVAIREKIIE
jgi:hypothetical protein